MANHITNDHGETVIAIGAPGSEARALCEWPGLIAKLNLLYEASSASPGRRVDDAVMLIRAAGVTSDMETSSILQASSYGSEPPGSVAAYVITCGRTRRDEYAEMMKAYERNQI